MDRLPTVVLISLITGSLCLLTAFNQFPWASLSSILGSAGKESACNVGDLGSTPGLGRSPGEGNGYPLQYSGLENSIDCVAQGVTKSWTRLSDFQLYLFIWLPWVLVADVRSSVAVHGLSGCGAWAQ